jgi:peroxiredoxin
MDPSAFDWLPPNLPVPLDDGAADHLEGMALPSMSFPSTDGGVVGLSELSRDGLVLYVYPRTGKPDEPLPVGWNETPGARGCTPESCGFRDRLSEFSSRGFTVAGLSAQPADEQNGAARRLALPFPLLSDPDLKLAGALRLPTFHIAGMTLYKRLTLVAHRAVILKVFYPVFPPDAHAGEVLTWLDRHGSEEVRRASERA